MTRISFWFDTMTPDWEIGVGVVIGQAARNVESPRDAPNHVIAPFFLAMFQRGRSSLFTASSGTGQELRHET